MGSDHGKYLIAMKIITTRMYHFKFDHELYKVLLISVLLCGLTFLLTTLDNVTIKYVSMGAMIILSSIFTIFHLNRKTDFISKNGNKK